MPVARHLEQIAISHLSSGELVALKKTLRQIYQNLTHAPAATVETGRSRPASRKLKV
jgi:hypothetical protein